ncbi:MAG: arginine--tRNA ligase [Oscillospiraceae bacterium]|jgi:arginyl-tRNA synthetase|nr:arginine--tRNA ligase [Oscillospiraceae bacterium]
MTETTKSLVKETVIAALGTLVADGVIPAEPLPAFSVEIPARSELGDFSCNVALAASKTLDIPSRKIAELIAGNINTEGSVFDKVEIAGPGFVNFFVKETWYGAAVNGILKKKGDYGRTDAGEGKRVLVEFVSANPTGPMHIGNARGGALGDCLASILEFAGYEAKREFYVNDAGNQIEKFGLSLDIRYRQELGEDIKFPEEAYKGGDITEHAKAFIAERGDRYLNVSEAERRKALVDYALPINIKGLKDDLLKYRIEYDNWFYESELHKNGAALKIVETLKERGHTYELDGAVWFEASKFGNEKDVVLIRKNGVPTYIVPDMAYHYNKLAERGFDIAVDILGADHHGYVSRMNAALTALGINAARLKVIIMQMVRLVKGGETVKISKRSGKAITLNSLLEEVPLDAARFFFNLRDANTHLDFDLDLAVEETSKNPVYYVQYAHARVRSVIRRLSDEGITRAPGGSLTFSAKEERDLIRKLAAFPEEINEAAKAFDPSRITRYIAEAAQLFHKFYDTCRVRGEDDDILQSRLALTEAAGVVIKNALTLMKIDAPEKM